MVIFTCVTQTKDEIADIIGGTYYNRTSG
jgi:hypothetical protein